MCVPITQMLTRKTRQGLLHQFLLCVDYFTTSFRIYQNVLEWPFPFCFSEAPRFPWEGRLIFSTMNCYNCNSCQAMDFKADFHFFSSVCKQSRSLKPRRVCSTWVSCDTRSTQPSQQSGLSTVPFRYFQIGVHESSGLTS